VYGLTRAGQTSWGDAQAGSALVVGVLLLGAFWAVENRVAQPLVPVHILRRKSLAWGNLAGLLAFATETSVVFLLTLYLQKVLGYSPLSAGMSFAVLGVGTVAGGVAGPKIIAAVGSTNALIGGFLVQALATVPLAFLGTDSRWILVLLMATFAGGVANLIAIVAFMVTATTGLPDDEQGLATGLATMSQQVGITLGIPVMSAIATAHLHGAGSKIAVLHGVSTALTVNAIACVVVAGLIAAFLRP
jgi:predicted MFS family arabinose efflux permease